MSADRPSTNFPVIRGRTVRVDGNGLVCLNDIHRAAGFSVNHKPSEWRDNPSTAPIQIAVLERITNKSGDWTKEEMRSAIYAKVGKDGGTYADVRLALAYAEYLSPALAVEVKEVFLRYKAADATLADDILGRAGPEANEWAGTRALGRSVRGEYTATLQGHGAKGKDFAICTNAVYSGLFDKTAKQLKATRGVTKKTSSLRDKMTRHELVFVMASEALSTERIVEERCDGGGECLVATTKSARFIRQAIDADRNDRRGRPQQLL